MPDRLQILGPCGWWAEGVRSGRYERDAGPVGVAVVMGPEADEDGALDRWRDRSAGWIGRSAPGVLSLLGVERVGRRTTWVYEDCDGVSLAAIVAAEQGPLPHRLAAEAVARCAEILEPLAATGRFHPGPNLDDVLLLQDGSVRIAGFVGPFARSPVHREPGGAEDAAAVVWRLGVLLAEALTGGRPTPATERGGHELMLRRLLIRIMSRPGPMFAERYRDWLCGMLAWDAAERPLLSRIAPGLQEIASTLGEPDLVRWAGHRIRGLRGRAPATPLVVTDLPFDAGPADVGTLPPERTEEAALPDLPPTDDVTAVSADGDPPGGLGPSFVIPEQGTIPVAVGPPPEAVPRATRLPDELFRETRGPPEPPRDRSWAAMIASAVLFALALLLSWYLWR